MTLLAPLMNIRVNLVALPDRAQCRVCGFFDATNLEVVEIMKEAGRRLREAACKCADPYSEKNIADKRRWENSNLPHRRAIDQPRTLPTFRPRKGLAEALEAAKGMAMGGGGARLTLSGPRRTGKTHLLEAIGREWLHNQRSVRYDYAADLVDELRAASSTASEVTVDELLKWRSSIGLLLLDDLGRDMNDFAVKTILQIVDERVRNGGALVVATNYASRDQLADVDTYLADRIFGRGAEVVYLECEPYEVSLAKAGVS